LLKGRGGKIEKKSTSVWLKKKREVPYKVKLFKAQMQRKEYLNERSN